jgi:hypothetical protein
MPDNRSMMPSFACMVAADSYGTTVRSRPNLFIDQITPYVSLESAFQRLKQVSSRAKPLKALFVVAHIQFENVPLRNAAAPVSTILPPVLERKAPVGIGLGHEGIFASNVWLWKAIEGHARTIVVYSCLAARTTRDMTGTFGDMKYLMGALAIHTGAHVYAADEAQTADVQKDDVDFGHWEGALFEFPPSGAPPRQVASAPYNLSDA